MGLKKSNAVVPTPTTCATSSTTAPTAERIQPAPRLSNATGSKTAGRYTQDAGGIPFTAKYARANTAKPTAN